MHAQPADNLLQLQTDRQTTYHGNTALRYASHGKNVRKTVNKRGENRHFQRPHSHLTPPLQRTPANICINLILPETTFPGLHFVADSIWVALHIFEQFCPKSGDANPLVTSP